MSVRQWQGKSQNVRTVGPSKVYDHQTVQAALDFIVAAGDSAADNRYRVDIDCGYYNERVDVRCSHTDILVRPGAVISYVPGTDTTGGTFRIGIEHGVYVEDVWLGGGGRIVRNASGAKPISPPEAAIYVGGIEDEPEDAAHFNNVTIEGITAEGVHDAIQVFGVSPDFAGTESPLLSVKNCLMRSVHDALCMKGAVRMYSVGNMIFVDTRGVDPYLTNIAVWKSTGIHINMNRPIGANWSSFTAERWFESHGDHIMMLGGDNLGGGASQDAMVGILIYDQSANVGSVLPARIFSPTISLRYDEDYSPHAIAGIAMILLGGTSCGPGDCVIDNASIDVRQLNTGASAPADMYGVLLQGSPSIGTREIQVTGSAYIENAAGNAYVCRAEETTDTIKHAVISEQSNDSGGAGTLTALGFAT